MRKELKRCNFLGNIDSLHYFVEVAIVDYQTNIDAIKSICSLNNKLNLNATAAVFFLEEIGMISIDATNKVISTEFGRSFNGCNVDTFRQRLSDAVYLYLIENGMIALEAISYDHTTHLCHIRRSGFPLTAAVFRNLLLEFGALIEISSSEYQVHDDYEAIFESTIKKQRPKVTLEELMGNQQKQAEQGRLAEEFVVAYEKNRLQDPNLVDGVKQISDIDVTAGYDVVSYDDKYSECYNRFIEVKSYHGTPQFFWSANEYETAKKLGTRYHIYLIDMDKYQHPGYTPVIVSDPSTILNENEHWISEVASWKITKI
jgi:hypothetical protein